MYLKAYFDNKEKKEQEIKEYTDQMEVLELMDVKYLRKDVSIKYAERFVARLIFEGKLKIAEGQEEYFERVINDYLDNKEAIK